jgi:hypothetical protein
LEVTLKVNSLLARSRRAEKNFASRQFRKILQITGPEKILHIAGRKILHITGGS